MESTVNTQSIEKPLDQAGDSELHQLHIDIPSQNLIEAQDPYLQQSKSYSFSLRGNAIFGANLSVSQLHILKLIIKNKEGSGKDQQHINLLESKGLLLQKIKLLINQISSIDQPTNQVASLDTLNLEKLVFESLYFSIFEKRPIIDKNNIDKQILIKLVGLIAAIDGGAEFILHYSNSEIIDDYKVQIHVIFDRIQQIYEEKFSKQTTELLRLVNVSSKSRYYEGYSFKQLTNLIFPFMSFYGEQLDLTQEENRKLLAYLAKLEQMGNCIIEYSLLTSIFEKSKLNQFHQHNGELRLAFMLFK
ncbi:hypothetical protein FGO68_gene3790 [Halteria grandinella]|uniref:Uncharacterized protein n=1 Tax=Halteria grandinella TaxID=5974 RepID=A0A8J8NXZ6_HALGN|nr:hypothetical protein FGO68_gene3790 [Halteria grandinella]